MNPTKNPTSDDQNPPLRNCKDCGDLFVVTHDLMQYCPRKFDTANYCKHNAKKKLNEARLAEMAINLSKAGIEAHSVLSPAELSVKGIKTIMGLEREKYVSGDLLETNHVNLDYPTYRKKDASGKPDILIFGDFSVIWVPSDNNILTCKITHI